MALLAWGAFQILVAGEVRRAMSLHVADKAHHLVDMFKADRDLLAALGGARIDPERSSSFADMARTIHVGTVFLYDASGRLMVRMDKNQEGSGAFANWHQHTADAAAPPWRERAQPRCGGSRARPCARIRGRPREFSRRRCGVWAGHG